MDAFTGTWRLVRLALRLDRIKLTIWIVAITALTAASAVALKDAYSTYEQQVQYAATTAPSTVGRAFGGLINGPSLGAITMVELFNFTAVVIAFMSSLLVVRHTRKPEETGAGELISAGQVGRYASLTATMIVAILANILVGLLIWLSMKNTPGLSELGSFGFSAALACTGIVFAGVAGIAAQLSETARGANSIAGGTIGVAFILRAIGDGFGNVGADGLSATPLWPTWLSPFGWGFQIHPFTEQNWLLFGLLIGFMLLSMLSSFIILRHRDVGLGIIPTRAGRANAKPKLLSTWGLSWRLQRATLIGWSIGFVVFGLVAGGMAHDFSSLIASNPDLGEMFVEFSEGVSLTDTFFGFMFGFAGVTAAGYVIQSLQKIRSEESSGHLESLLGTGLSRGKWIASHLLVTVFGIAVLLTIMGVMSGVVHVLATDASWNQVGRLTIASLNQFPAVLAFAGGIVLFLGALPTLAVGLAWGAFVGSFLILQLSALLGLPDWVINISPFAHAPNAPIESTSILSIVSLVGIACVLAYVGLLRFWRRDITTSS